jgi:hypothetical protein
MSGGEAGGKSFDYGFQDIGESGMGKESDQDKFDRKKEERHRKDD